MELTVGELIVIVDTLEHSLNIANWSGYDANSRQKIINKIVNDQEMKMELKVVRGA